MKSSGIPAKYDDPSLYYSSMQPSLYENDYDLQCCNTGTSVSEELFDKFDLGCLTPPLSPELLKPVKAVEVPDVDNFTSSFLNPYTPPAETQLGTEYNPSQFKFMKEFPDLKDACNELFDDSMENSLLTCNKIKTDCMWNGVGHKPHATSRRVGTNSPQEGHANPVSGCVDPQAVFNCRYTGCKNAVKRKCSPRRPKMIESPETPSDSEEEIDVVTVDKKNSPGKPTLPANGKRLVGTLLQKGKGVRQQLSLFKTEPLKTNAEQNRGRTTLKANGMPATSMALIINERKDGSNTKRVNYQLKRVPVVSSVTASAKGAAPKVCQTGSDGSSTTVVQLMRISPSSAVTVKTKEDTPSNCNVISQPVGGKRRIISLEGVSMVSNTGINRFKQKEKSPWIKREVVEMNGFIPMQPNIADKLERKKPTRKYTKRTVAAPTLTYETPANSPVSSGGDSSPVSPALKRYSSGSDEECQTRAAHNVLERQRREGLRTLFNTLRLAVPELEDNERAPKVAILKKSKEHVARLKTESKRLAEEKQECEQQHFVLQTHLQELASEMTSLSSFTYNTNSVSVKSEQISSFEHEQYSLFVD